ncbi:MAG: signal peptidase I [Spirochaetales bacterium]|nr:signal peptidase I [Spirochaetales bacterium]
MGSLLTLFIPLLSFFQVADVSMEPLLFEGDLIPVVRTKRIEPGDLVVFTDPQGRLAVKSCYLTEGDSLVIEGNYLLLEGGLWFLQPDQKDRLAAHPVVPPGTVFLLGENSFHSQDSREWGFIEKDVILGKVIGKKGIFIE